MCNPSAPSAAVAQNHERPACGSWLPAYAGVLPSSIPRCPRQRISMEVRIAEHLRQHARALHVEADIIFVGHADAAVHLDAFLNAERRRHPRHRLGDRDGGVGARIARVEQLLRLRSEEHTSELQSLMRISYTVFCLKKKNL